MKKIGLILSVIVLLIGVAYFWRHRYDYFFQGQMELKSDEPAEEKRDASFGEQDVNQSEDNERRDEEEIRQGSDLSNEYDEIELSDKSLESIITEDCKDQCASKKNDEKEYRYCREVCGLSEETVEPNDCETLFGIDRDSCFKSKAITEKDFQYCEKIMDVNMREACENRVSEEIMDMN